MKYADLIKEIKSSIFRPVYFLHGAEPYFIDSVVQTLSVSVLEPTEREFNQTILYGRDVVMADLIATLKSFPMMSNYKVIIVREAQEIKDKDFDALLQYAKQPQTSSILVLAYKKDAGKRMLGALAKVEANVVVFESPRIGDDKLPDWIIRYMSQKKTVVSPRIAQIIAGSLGNDLAKIVNELDKLCINLNEGAAVTMDDVEANIGISKKYNIFELQNAIAARQKAKAIEIACFFAANPKENPIFSMIPMLNSFFEKLFIYLQIGQSASPNEVAGEMNIKPYFLAEYQKASRNYNMKQVLGIFKMLRKYDLMAKGVGSLAPESELMREMVYKIVNI